MIQEGQTAGSPIGGPPSSGSDPQNRLKEHADTAKAKASQAAQKTKDAAKDAAEKVKAGAREAGEAVKQQASTAAQHAKDRGLEMLNEQKGRVASEILACSEAAKRAADRLEAESDTNLSRYVSSAATHLEQLGHRIEERDLGGLMEDAEDLARKRPEIFFGGMFVAGLAVARFLKASKQKRRREQSFQGRYSDDAGTARGADTASSTGVAPSAPADSMSASAVSPAAPTAPMPGGAGASPITRPGTSTGGTI